MEQSESTDCKEAIACEDPQKGWLSFLWEPYVWLAMLARELHGSFVYGVVIVYGLSQGLGGAFYRIASDYYWKDVQLVQPSAAQVYQGITSIPWVVKPVWGLLTDVLPVAGYRRRPYFIFAGLLGLISMLIISVHSKLAIIFAVLLLTAATGGVAIADVTIDACIAKNSIHYPLLAADMQSLCGMSSSVGALLGFSTSGLAVHHLGAQGALGLLCIPAILVFSLGFILNEPRLTHNAHKQNGGKTTLINALLSDEVATVGFTSHTSKVVPYLVDGSTVIVDFPGTEATSDRQEMPAAWEEFQRVPELCVVVVKLSCYTSSTAEQMPKLARKHICKMQRKLECLMPNR